MKEVQPIKELTVTYEDEKIKIFRQEMLEDDVLGDALTSYEKVLTEITEAEYEIKKLIHAKISMMNELKQLVLKHVVAKKNPESEDGQDKSQGE